MKDSAFVFLFIGIGILVVFIFLKSTKNSEIKNSKSNFISNILSFKVSQQGAKLKYEDVRKSLDSLSSVAALINT